jgi:solute carrier family 50 (sugar transporter)
VLRNRDSSSLTLPMCIMNTANGTLWLIYGLVLSDPFIWVPHGSGALLGVLQTVLRRVFPQAAAKRCAMVAE